MLSSRTTVKAKRQRFRQGLESGNLQRAPGAFSPLVAITIENKGFEAIYISGAALSADLGLPDIGLATQTEFLERGRQIARATNLPAIIDCDTGFGEPMHAYRTVRLYEDAGFAGIHIEDQSFPKRCGHLDNKAIIPQDEMVRKLHAACEGRTDPSFTICARTDACESKGLDAAIVRMKAYAEAGADLIFPEAMHNLDDFKKVRDAIDVPLLANMTEFGKSDLLTCEELESIGINLVIWPVTTLRLAMKAIDQALGELAVTGTQKNCLDRMQTRKELYDLLDYVGYNRFDQNLFDFKLN